MEIRSLLLYGSIGLFHLSPVPRPLFLIPYPLSLIPYSSSLIPYPLFLIPFPLYFYFFLFSASASPNGLFFAMSTNTGAATKMDE